MAGGVFSEAQLFGMTIRESATDGSDFTNPVADYRRLFLGEDGLLHVKDSAGVVTNPFTGGGISSGTSNPGSPADGDLFYRSDLDLFIRYRSSGTRWVCACPHSLTFGIQTAVVPTSVQASIYSPVPKVITNDVLVEDVRVGMFVNTTNNGSNFWSLTSGVTGAFGSTAADAANTILVKSFTTHTVFTINGAGWFQLDYVKTGAPGTLFLMPSWTYRYIVT